MDNLETSLAKSGTYIRADIAQLITITIPSVVSVLSWRSFPHLSAFSSNLSLTWADHQAYVYNRAQINTLLAFAL